MKKKLIVISLIFSTILILYLLIYFFILKNRHCKGEVYEYEIWTSTPINFTDKIESGECECLSFSLFINSKIKLFNKQQLLEIRKELPNWADKNIKHLTTDFKLELKEFINKADEELLDEIDYEYSFYERETESEVYVSTIKIKSLKIYLLNYQNVYSTYDKYPTETQEGLKYIKKERPNLPIIETESWIKENLGEKGL